MGRRPPVEDAVVARAARWVVARAPTPRRSVRELLGDPRYSKPGLNALDDKLARYLSFRGGFFVEAGANDGFTQSNTYYLERMLGWRGVLVEPVPALYERCRRLRSSSMTFWAALVDAGETATSVEVHVAGLTSCVAGAFGSREADERHLAAGRRVQRLAPAEPARVPARTLSSILDEARAPRVVDFLSIDVEGGELGALGGLDRDHYRSRHILVEARDPAAVANLLRPTHDLVEKMSHHDYFFRLRPGAEPRR